METPGWDDAPQTRTMPAPVARGWDSMPAKKPRRVINEARTEAVPRQSCSPDGWGEPSAPGQTQGMWEEPGPRARPSNGPPAAPAEAGGWRQRPPTQTGTQAGGRSLEDHRGFDDKVARSDLWKACSSTQGGSDFARLTQDCP